MTRSSVDTMLWLNIFTVLYQHRLSVPLRFKNKKKKKDLQLESGQLRRWKTMQWYLLVHVTITATRADRSRAGVIRALIRASRGARPSLWKKTKDKWLRWESIYQCFLRSHDHHYHNEILDSALQSVWWCSRLLWNTSGLVLLLFFFFAGKMIMMLVLEIVMLTVDSHKILYFQGSIL